MNLIERLEEANQNLIGAAAHHKAIKDTIEYLKKHSETLELSDQIFQAARPLVLNMMCFESARKELK